MAETGKQGCGIPTYNNGGNRQTSLPVSANLYMVLTTSTLTTQPLRAAAVNEATRQVPDEPRGGDLVFPNALLPSVLFTG